MKKITLLVVFVALFFGAKHIQAQVNITTNWPDSDWEVVGSFSLGENGDAFTQNPTDNPYSTPTPGANFGYDDYAAGSGSFYDWIAAESPEIDLTPARAAGENQIVISGEYIYSLWDGSELLLEWSDADSAGIWVPWYTFTDNSTSWDDYRTCSGMQSYASTPLIIAGFSPSQLEHFRFRFRYIGDNYCNGFCMGAPSINSQDTPLCFDVSSINTDSAEIEYDTAVISWNDDNDPDPQDGWEIEYGNANFTQGSGTTFNTYTNSYTISGLDAVSCYDVYVRALCDNATDTTSEWVGPFNFCTPAETLHCGSDFYDEGGPANKYPPSFTKTETVDPDITGNLVTVIFNSFSLEVGGSGPYDWLKIYDGDSTSSPQIMGPDNNGTFSGTNSPGMITASEDLTVNPTGSLTFEFKSDGSGQEAGWEARILCSPPITCFMPENLAVNEASITIHETEVSWTDTNDSTPTSGWDIEYGPIGFEQGTGIVVNADSNPFTLTGLDAATEYCYYVKASCGASSGDEDSFWEGPVCFTTKCDIYSAPFTENFENGGVIPACWDQGAANSEDWLFSNDVTAPGHIGNGGNVSGTTTLSGGYFAYIDDDSPNSIGTTLISPYIDITGVTDPTLGFYYISHHEFLFRNVNFSVEVWDGAAWNDVFTHTGNTNGWEQIFVDLSGLVFTGPIQMKFIVDEDDSDGIFDDFAIDDIFVGEMPECVNVNSTSLDNVGSNDATFTWNDGNSPEATNWQIVYGDPDFNPDTATPIDTTNNNAYLLEGLFDQTDYEVYIRANCGSGEYSLWAGPIAFRTLCPIFSAPYHENFEDAGALDSCWTQNEGIDSWQFSNTPGVGDASHVGDDGDIFGTHTISDNYFAFIDNSDPKATNNTIFTPSIDVSSLDLPTLYFYFLSHNEGGSNVSFSIEVWDGADWTTGFYTSNSNSDNGWEQRILDLSDLNITGPIQVKFIVNENNGSSSRDDFAIDDIEIKEAPDCWPIFDLVVSNETTTTVDVAWLDSDNDVPPTTYHVEYGAVGFEPGTGTTQEVDMTTTTYNPYTVTGLSVDTDFDFYLYADCPNGESMIGPVPGATLPTCLEISGFTMDSSTTDSINVSWVDNNDTSPPGGWDVEVTFPSFGQGTGQINTAMSLPFIITSDPSIATPTYDNIIPSSTYEIYIRANCEVDGSDPSRWTGPFTVITQVGPPLNDACENAIELAVTVSCEPTLGNNIQATETTPAIETNCSNPANDGIVTVDDGGYAFKTDDVWYKFTMPSVGTVTVFANFAGGMEDNVMAVYKVEDGSDPCGSLVFSESLSPNGEVDPTLFSCYDDSDFDIDDEWDNNLLSHVMIKNQTPGEEYYVRVWSYDRTNITVPSPGENVHGQFTICVIGGSDTSRFALSTENESITDDLILDYYPNPVDNKLNISSNTTIKELKMYNLLGQTVASYTFNSPTVEVDTKTLQSGTYFVKVLLEGDRTKTIKIIKN